MGARPTERLLIKEAPATLARVLDVPEQDVKVDSRPPPDVDLMVNAAGQDFAVEVLGAASLGIMTDRANRVAAAARLKRRKVVPLLAVPFMSEAGRRVCEKAQIGWFDLSGNAHIVAPGIRVIVEGRPNRFRTVGRPASIFAPKSARVVRWLLENEGRAPTQRDIARGTEMTDGFVSRIVARLAHDGYVLRDAGGLRVKDPQLLLDAWRAEYRFDKHGIIQGHVAARSGDALARFVGDTLSTASIQHAATGLAAAWQMTHFAAFRIATFFLSEHPSTDLLARLGFREEARGANLWLVTPNDAGVFQGAEELAGLRCVHPVQAYVDLKAHPERATEAAEQLRAELLK